MPAYYPHVIMQVFLVFVAVVYNNITNELSAAPKLKCECLQNHLLG